MNGASSAVQQCASISRASPPRRSGTTLHVSTPPSCVLPRRLPSCAHQCRHRRLTAVECGTLPSVRAAYPPIHGGCSPLPRITSRVEEQGDHPMTIPSPHVAYSMHEPGIDGPARAGRGRQMRRRCRAATTPYSPHALQNFGGPRSAGTDVRVYGRRVRPATYRMWTRCGYGADERDLKRDFIHLGGRRDSIDAQRQPTDSRGVQFCTGRARQLGHVSHLSEARLWRVCGCTSHQDGTGDTHSAATGRATPKLYEVVSGK